MADTPQDVVNRELREFRRYTGDGLPGEPVNAPLPVGDPQSGVHNPKKHNLRKALMAPVEAAAQSASDAAGSAEQAALEADRAEAEADRAATNASSVVARAWFKTVADLLSDDNAVIGYAGAAAQFDVQAGDIITAQGFRYEVAASGADPFDPDTAPNGYHIETAGSVKLIYLPAGLPVVEALTAARYPDSMADGLVLAVKIASGARFASAKANVEGARFDFQIRDLRIDASNTHIENLSETGDCCLIFEEMVYRFGIDIKRLTGGANAGPNFMIGSGFGEEDDGNLYGSGRLNIVLHEHLNPNVRLFAFAENDASLANCGRMTNVHLIGQEWRHPQNGTVSPFHKDSAFGTMNNVRFSIMQHFCSSDHPFYQLLTRSEGQYFTNLIWDKCGFEYCLGGAVHLSGASDAEIGHIMSYDTNHNTDGVLRKDTVWLGSYNDYIARYPEYDALGTGTLPCRAPKVLGVGRYGASSLPDDGAGTFTVVDIRFEDARDWFLESFGAGTIQRNVTVDCGPREGTILHAYNANLQNFNSMKHLLVSPNNINSKNVRANGEVAANGALSNGFGVSSVTKPSTGTYRINLPSAALGIIIPIIALRNASRVWDLTPVDSDTIEITIRDLSGTLQDTAFSFAIVV